MKLRSSFTHGISNTLRIAMNASMVIVGLLLTLSVACQRSPEAGSSRVATIDSRANAGSYTSDVPSKVQDETMRVYRPDQAATDQNSTRDQDLPSEHFKVLSATSQRWFSGVASGGRGIDYSFKVQITTTEPISFDTAWIGNRGYEIAVAKEVGRVSSQPVIISIGDQIVLLVSIMVRKADSTSEAESSLDHVDQARIMYHVNGKPAFLTVKNIQSQIGHNRP